MASRFIFELNLGLARRNRSSSDTPWAWRLLEFPSARNVTSWVWSGSVASWSTVQVRCSPRAPSTRMAPGVLAAAPLPLPPQPAGTTPVSATRIQAAVFTRMAHPPLPRPAGRTKPYRHRPSTGTSGKWHFSLMALVPIMDGEDDDAAGGRDGDSDG